MIFTDYYIEQPQKMHSLTVHTHEIFKTDHVPVQNNNLQKLYKSFKINNGYSIYGQKMTSDVGSTKMTSCTNNIKTYLQRGDKNSFSYY